MPKIEEEEECLKDYNPLPKILKFSDCLKIYGGFFSSDDLLLHQDITLHDPITLKRLRAPCRAVNCEHFQCFDYDCYLELNKRKSPCEFICPICKEGANPTKIYIDSIWLNLLKHFPDSSKVRINADGKCQDLSESKGSSSVILIDDDEEVVSVPSSSGAVALSMMKNHKAIYIANFEFEEVLSMKEYSFLSNYGLTNLDELFDCNIDDILYFINNCKVQDLQIIPSIGEYYAERIIKARPFISCTIAALRHDFLLKLNRLKASAAGNMIDNLKRVVKSRIQQIQARYLENSHPFQSLSSSESNLKEQRRKEKSTLKRLKRMKEKSMSDDEPFSPIKSPSKRKSKTTSTSSQSIEEEQLKSVEKKKKRKSEEVEEARTVAAVEAEVRQNANDDDGTPQTTLPRLSSSYHSSKKQKRTEKQVSETSSNVETASLETMSSTYEKKSKKAKKDKDRERDQEKEKERAKEQEKEIKDKEKEKEKQKEKEKDRERRKEKKTHRTEKSNLLLQSPQSNSDSTISILPSSTIPVMSNTQQGKKIYFIQDEEEHQQQQNEEKGEVPGGVEEVRPLKKVKIEESGINHLHPQTAEISLPPQSIQNSNPFVLPPPLIWEPVEETHSNLVPSLLFDEEDFFGSGFISTVTRPLEDLTALSDSEEQGKQQQLQQKNAGEGSKHHIRFSDEDSDTTTQTTSSHYESEAPQRSQTTTEDPRQSFARPKTSLTTRSVVLSSSSPPSSSSSPQNRLQLLPVFNPTTAASFTAPIPIISSSTVAASSPSTISTFPTIGMENISDSVLTFVPFKPLRPSAATTSASASTTAVTAVSSEANNTSRGGGRQRSRTTGSGGHRSASSSSSATTVGSPDSSSSIVQLMISEFATGF